MHIKLGCYKLAIKTNTTSEKRQKIYVRILKKLQKTYSTETVQK